MRVPCTSAGGAGHLEPTLSVARTLRAHGGSGTLVAGLTAGVPDVVLPLDADRCVVLGAGLALDAVTASQSDVRRAVLDVPELAVEGLEQPPGGRRS